MRARASVGMYGMERAPSGDGPVGLGLLLAPQEPAHTVLRDRSARDPHDRQEQVDRHVHREDREQETGEPEDELEHGTSRVRGIDGSISRIDPGTRFVASPTTSRARTTE